MKTYCVQNEDEISNIIKKNAETIQIVFKNIKKRFNTKSFSSEKDFFLFEASPILSQQNVFNTSFIIMFENVKNEFGEFFSSLVNCLSENDVIVIVNGIVSNKNDYYHVYVQPESDSSVFLFKLNSLSYSESNLLPDKNLSKISGTGIYSIFGYVRETAISNDKECMWIRIKCSDKSCINILRYPFAVHDTRRLNNYKKYSNHVDILVENPCNNFISLVFGHRIHLKNVKVNRVDNSDCFLLCVQGITDHLIALKIKNDNNYLTPLQQQIQKNKLMSVTRLKSNQIPINKMKPTSTSHLKYRCVPNSSLNYYSNSLSSLSNKCSSNFAYSTKKIVSKRTCCLKENIKNYLPRKIVKQNAQTDTEINKIKKMHNIVFRKYSPDVEGMYLFLPSDNPDVFDSNISNTGPHLQVLHLSYLDEEKSLRGCGIRCIGPCRPINIEPCLILNDNDSSDFLSGYCEKCFSFTPKSYLISCKTQSNEEYRCSKCHDFVYLTFFFILNFLYGKNESQAIKICCYSEKAERFLKKLSKKNIKVEDYLLNYNCRKLVVDTMRKFIFEKTKVNLVVLNSPLDNAFILVSLSTKNIINN